MSCTTPASRNRAKIAGYNARALLRKSRSSLNLIQSYCPCEKCIVVRERKLGRCFVTVNAGSYVARRALRSHRPSFQFLVIMAASDARCSLVVRSQCRTPRTRAASLARSGICCSACLRHTNTRGPSSIPRLAYLPGTVRTADYYNTFSLYD